MTRPYTPEFKRQMVELARSGRNPEALGREFDPSPESIRSWVRQAELKYHIVPISMPVLVRPEIRPPRARPKSITRTRSPRRSKEAMMFSGLMSR